MRHTITHAARTTTRLATGVALALAPGALAGAVPGALAAQPPTQPAQGGGRITGIVTDQAGQPVPSAQVQVVGTARGALTGPDGRFTIGGVAPGTYEVRVQRLGYAPRSVQVAVTESQPGSAIVQIQSAAAQLTAQVVVGYTTQQRRDVSDATAGVRAEQLTTQKVATVEQALRGQIPGVQVAATGEPGRPAQVIIRGQTFLNSAGPLYVVDGVYMGQNPNLNPDDIESIEVLKDASATAQYGAQSANGVIVIRTRRGRPGENRVEARTYYGTQQVPKRIAMADAQEWATIVSQAYQNAGQPVPAGARNPQFNTDWQDAVFTRGAIQDHSLSMSGGSQNANFLVSGGYLKQAGTIIQTDFERYSFRVNSEARRGRLTFGEAVAVSTARRQFLDGFPLIDVVRFPPTIAVYDSTNPGGFGFGSDAVPTFGTNPVGALMVRDNGYRSNQVIGSTYADVAIVGGLRYRLNLGINYDDYTQKDFARRAQLRFRSGIDSTRLTRTDRNSYSMLVESLLSYDGAFGGGRHRLSATGGVTGQRLENEELSAYREGYSNDRLQVINAGPTTNLRNGGFLVQTALRSALARAAYTLADRYTLTGTVRRDGSSRFGAGNKYGTFGAASVGWTVSEEGFYDAVPLLNRASFLKLRLSYGILGNQDIGDYAFTAPIAQNLNYLFGSGVVSRGATQLALANADLRWQEDKQGNVGLDLGLWGDRLNITADVYSRESDGVLVNAPIPFSTGASGSPTVNAGSIRSRGWEVGATHRWESGRLRLNTAANLTHNTNKVLALGNGGQPIFAGFSGVARTTVGGSIGELYVKKTGGLFQSDADVKAHTTTVNGRTVVLQPNAKPGDVRYLDLNGDGQINNDDRYVAGNPNPTVSGGLFLDGGYGALDLGLNFRGSYGAELFNVVRYWTDRLDDVSNFRSGLKPWTPQNTATTTPRAVIGVQGAANADPVSDRWIEKANFLRVQNIILGYTLPGPAAQRLGLRGEARPRVYVNVQNVVTFSGFSNWDPEAFQSNLLARGFDDGSIYPNPRTITVGLDLRF